MKQIKPDVVVNDFTSYAGTFAADSLGVPVVINMPGPITFFEEWGFEVPNMRKAH